ncbi:MAG TPA: N-acetylglucosamine-6-phosphate deacetylase [Chitinophagaceae bacterium]|nr:N-acetylglucosamine-6-phosphate deacetylase [Chitinophagaceae bacterium]
MQLTYVADQIFTGSKWITEKTAVITNNGIITSIEKVHHDVPDGAITFDGGLLIPSFIDLQIYGANRKLFAVYPTTEALQDLYTYCAEGGAPLFQPTVATNKIEVFYACIDAVRAYWLQGGKGLIGLHLEGPWINEEKRGAHIKEWIHEPQMEEVKGLLEYGKGVISMITLAPEVCSPEIIKLIQSYGIIVSAGHSNATYQEAMQSLDEGIPVITHLYNAMSPLQHRAPGLVGAAFQHSSARASIIPDGYHVDYAAVAIAVEMMKDRLFVITDAVTETDKGRYQHKREGEKYEAGGILSGSALTMYKAFINLVREVKVPLGAAANMCSLYPARVMGLDKQYGEIAPGYAAQFLVLDKDLNLLNVVAA